MELGHRIGWYAVGDGSEPAGNVWHHNAVILPTSDMVRLATILERQLKTLEVVRDTVEHGFREAFPHV